MKKILLSLYLLLALLIIPTIALATGTGSETEPYLVSNMSELSEAITTGGYIKLTSNINLGEFTGAKFTIQKNISITLDLNGYTISGKNSSEKFSTSIITNKGTLVINDSSSQKTGKLTLSDTNVKLNSYAYGIFTINNNGTLTINGGTIENTGGTDVPYAIDNNSTIGNTTLTINGGNIISNKAAIRSFANSTTYSNDIIVNGGNITGSCSLWLQQSNKNAHKLSLTVNGGTLIGEKSYSIYADVNNDDTSNVVSISINGGIIKNNSNTKATVAFLPRTGNSLENAKLNLNITAGTITNENPNGTALFDSNYANINTDNIHITGGTFSSDVSSYMDTSVKMTQDKNGNYIVATPSQLDKPTNLIWEEKMAKWDKVSNASKYQVVLYDKSSSKTFETSENFFDFTSNLTDKTEKYFFVVTAIGDGIIYLDSEGNYSEIYAFPVEKKPDTTTSSKKEPTTNNTPNSQSSNPTTNITQNTNTSTTTENTTTSSTTTNTTQNAVSSNPTETPQPQQNFSLTKAKDDTPATGSANFALYIIAIISIIGLAIKYILNIK